MDTSLSFSLAGMGFGGFSGLQLLTIIGDDNAENIEAATYGTRIEGNGGDDTLTGGAANDTLLGGAGIDNLAGGVGGDSLDGGANDDTVHLVAGHSNANAVLDGGADTDTLAIAADGANTTYDLRTLALSNFETLYTGSAMALVQLFADQAGFDTLHVGVASSTDFELFMDTAFALDLSAMTFVNWSYRNDITIVGDGDGEHIIAGNVPTRIEGNGGDDTLTGGTSSDTLLGGDGNDVLTGGAGFDSVDGGAHDDIVTLTAGNENSDAMLDGGADTDILAIAANGANTTYDLRSVTIANFETLYAGTAITQVQLYADQLEFDTFRVDGSSGTAFQVFMSTFATLDMSSLGFENWSATNGFTIAGDWDTENIMAGNVATRMEGQGGNDTLTGSTDNNVLRAGAGDDFLSGWGGADFLLGERGNDTLMGGGGSDTLAGGTGADSLIGGTGRDAFVFHAGGGADTVADFANDVDRLRLDQDLWGGVLSIADLLTTYGSVTGGVATLDFGGGNIVTVHNVTALTDLENDIRLF